MKKIRKRAFSWRQWPPRGPKRGLLLVMLMLMLMVMMSCACRRSAGSAGKCGVGVPWGQGARTRWKAVPAETMHP